MDAEPAEVAGDCALFYTDQPGTDGEGPRFSVGDLSVDGGVGEQVLPYDNIGEGYSVDANLVFDLWEPGNAVTVAAPGGDLMGGFELSATGPDDFAQVEPNGQTGIERAGTTVRWDPGNGDEIIAFFLNSGGTEIIRCTSDDDGSVEVPAAAFGWLPAGVNRLVFTLHRVTRARVMSAAPEGDVLLELSRIHRDPNLELR